MVVFPGGENKSLWTSVDNDGLAVMNQVTCPIFCAIYRELDLKS